MIKTYKYRISPNREQSGRLATSIELNRRLYNVALEQKIIAYKQSRKFVSCYDQINQLPELKESFPEYKNIHSQSQQDTLRRLDKSFKSFFGRIKKGGKAGFPHFKGRDFYNSIIYPQSGFSVKDNRLVLSKIGNIKIKLHRELKNKIKTCSIIRENDKWFVCFTIDCGVMLGKKPIQSAIGIDLGLESFATLSDGTKIDNPRCLRQLEEKLSREQRWLSRKKKGSNNRQKQKVVVAKVHCKIRNQRNDFTHKLSRELVNKYDLIVYEDLAIKNMVKNRYLAKSISDASWNGFCQKLLYKADECGKYALPVSPRNTSQKCSNCGEIVQKALWVRRHKCNNCGIDMDRDENASINILKLGMEEYRRNYGNQRLGREINRFFLEPRSRFCCKVVVFWGFYAYFIRINIK